MHLPHARLLFIIAELYQQDKITESQKLALKYGVLKDDWQLLELFDENSDDIEKVNEELVKFANE